MSRIEHKRDLNLNPNLDLGLERNERPRPPENLLSTLSLSLNSLSGRLSRPLHPHRLLRL